VNEQRNPEGTLWARAVAATARARASGALQPIATIQTIVEDQGIPFLVRVLAGASGRAALRAKEINANIDPSTVATLPVVTSPVAPVGVGGPDFDPFLPYEPDMWVADVAPAHVCLLNKFNVIDHHLLVVTRAFEEQERAITAADFAALWGCMAEIDGLAFYNGGRVAGASQRHKHLQLTPLPWGPGGQRLPVEAALAVEELTEEPQVRPWPYIHAAVALAPQAQKHPAAAGEWLQARYAALLEVFDIKEDARGLLGAYNLLCTRAWMMVVPRRAESYENVMVNALGFAGSLLVRSEAQLEQLRAMGVLAVLNGVVGE
jgi:ATP adenylyltransferase